MRSEQTAGVVAELLRLEAELRRATTGLDESGQAMPKEAQATLAALFADELTITHVDGRTETKADFLAFAAGQVRNALSGLRTAVDAQALTVRVYGEVGVLTGRHRISLEGREPLEYVVIQVWVKRAPSWQLVAWQATRTRSSAA